MKSKVRTSWKWLVLWSLWAARLVRQPTPQVLVSNGWLRGTVAPAGTHVQYLGVPYATVPHRFQPVSILWVQASFETRHLLRFSTTCALFHQTDIFPYVGLVSEFYFSCG
ncbi:hypothetical protein evm_015173, partial [Chilo suppressalis]